MDCPAPIRTVSALIMACICACICACFTGVWISAQAEDDPYSEILASKNLQDRAPGVKRARRSKLKYAMGPWFDKGSNFERLFRDPTVTSDLIEWIAPVGKSFLTGDPHVEYHDTHIHVDAIVQERATRNQYGLTILVPHPAFLTVVDGNLVSDFSQRIPPALKVAGSEKMKNGSYEGTAYSLQSDRCSLVFNVSRHVLIELRSIEVCRNNENIISLAESLNLIKLDQKLQS